MTTPLAPVAPTGAPVSGAVDHNSPHGIQDAMDQMTAEAIAATISNTEIPATGTAGTDPTSATPPATPPKADANAAEPVTREDGATWNETAKRWKNADGSFAEGAPPVPVVNADGAEPDAPAIELPEGMVAIPAIEGRELATKFRVLDHEGELDVPDLTIEFTANGKVRNEPLDKVVRLAERGVYNEEREQQVVQTREQNQQITARLRQVEQYAQQLHAERERLLTSDEAYLTARAEYEAANTPEARLAKLHAEREQEQHLALYGQARQLTNQYFTSTVIPAVEKISTTLPGVTADEIGARLVLLTNHLRIATPDGDTMIPPSAFEAVGRIIVSDIVPWAQQLHDERDRSTSSQRQEQERRQKEADAKAEAARIEAQRSKNLLAKQGRRGKGGSASGNSGNASTRQTQQQKPITNIDDAMNSAVSDALAAVGVGG